MEDRLYIFDTDELTDPEVFGRCLQRMPAYRRDKVSAYRFGRDKRLSLGAGMLLEDFVCSVTGTNDILTEPEGRPYLAAAPGVHFNLSHSGHYAVLAVSDRPVGVDIELTHHFDDSLARFVYTDSEIEAAVAGFERDAALTRLWTVKESVMKQLGTGMALAPKQVTVIQRHPARVRAEGFDCSALRFTEYHTPEYALTVCSEHEPFAPLLTAHLGSGGILSAAE